MIQLHKTILKKYKKNSRKNITIVIYRTLIKYEIINFISKINMLNRGSNK